MAHEGAYIQHLESQGLSIVNLRGVVDEKKAVTETFAAMEGGADAIVQGAIAQGRWFGRADVLRKVARASRLGDWSYEVYDCKLALEIATGSNHPSALALLRATSLASRGNWPEFMCVIPPCDGFLPEAFRVMDFAAYSRYVKSGLVEAVVNDGNGIRATRSRRSIAPRMPVVGGV